MTTVHALTNLAAEQFLDLTVEPGQDIMTAARQTLFTSGLPESVQQGFFVSVYPIDEVDPTSDEVEPAADETDRIGAGESAVPAFDEDGEMVGTVDVGADEPKVSATHLDRNVPLV